MRKTERKRDSVVFRYPEIQGRLRLNLIFDGK